MLAKRFWKNGKCIRAAINTPYRARLQDDMPLFLKDESEEELVTEMPLILSYKRVPSWRGDFLGWSGQGCGLRGSLLSVPSQRWGSLLSCRSFATEKGKLDRRKRDLARREFQLLRRKTKLLKATLSPEERLLWRLRKANRKKGVLLHRLKKYELEEDPEPVHDPELITAEQLQALKKIGYKNRNYVPVGRRGVYGGVVQNMHMHWKFHETVQIDCHIFKREDVRSVARQLAVLSGGIVIDIHQATNIIMYRGKNYRQPKKEMIPPNTLTKRKALFKSKHLQALESLETVIKSIEADLHVVRRKQKESVAEGIENETGNLPQVVGDQIWEDKFLANKSKSSSDDVEDDDDDDGHFSWDSDSLDEDELSDDDEVKHKSGNKLQEDKITKPVSWTSEDSAPRAGKKKRLTAKELILAEQELFRNRRQEETAQKAGSISMQSDLSTNLKKASLDGSLKTNNESGNAEKDGVSKAKCYELDSSEDDILHEDVEKSKVATKGNGHDRIMNKKIAKFLEGFVSSSEEKSEELGSDFDDLDDLDSDKTRFSRSEEEEALQASKKSDDGK